MSNIVSPRVAETTQPPARGRSYHTDPPGATAFARADVAARRPEPAWIALGSNLGDPPTTLARALRWLAALPHSTLEATSTQRWTPPVGPPQPWYLNAVCRLRTRLPPEALLGALQALEHAAGRVREVRWGPRTLDLDLLLYADRVVASPTLVLPHPRWHERGFVIEPLTELEGAAFVAARRPARAGD